MHRLALVLITTGKQELDEVERVVGSMQEELAAGMCDAIHIREKHRGAREVALWCERLRRASGGVPVYVNDRLDAALAAEADGVQLGYTSLDAAAARRLLPPGVRVGVSIHTPAEAEAAWRAGADYALFGHVYATASKQGLPPRGAEALREAAAAAPLPVLAIGGIEPEHAAELAAAGAAGIAVLSGVLLRPDPAGRLRQYRAALDRAAAAAPPPPHLWRR